MPTRNVVLTDRQAMLVDSLVRSGRYQNASEVLRDGLRMLEARHLEEEAKLAGLRAGDSRTLGDAGALRAYVERITGENRHAEVPTGGAVGREFW